MGLTGKSGATTSPCHYVTASQHHCITASLHHCATLPPHHHITASPHHRITTSLHHCITVSPHHRVITLVSHLPCPLPPNQSVIYLAACHHTSQSFALLPATKPVSHLPCPLPPNQSVIWLALYHHITMSPWPLCHHVTIPLHHCTTASPRQCVTTPLHHDVTMPLHHCITAPLCHHIIASLHHCIIASLHHHTTMSQCPHDIFPTTWVWIWLVNTIQHSSDWLIVPTTANQITGIRSPHDHVTASLHHHVTVSPFHCVTVSPHHCITTSPHEIFPTTWVWIWLVNTTQHSSDWLIVPTTANQITGIEKPNYHKTLIFFPTTSLKRSHEARIDELADSNEPAIIGHFATSYNSDFCNGYHWEKHFKSIFKIVKITIRTTPPSLIVLTDKLSWS